MVAIERRPLDSGTRVKLVRNQEFTSLPTGTVGTIRSKRRMDTPPFSLLISVKWDYNHARIAGGEYPSSSLEVVDDSD